jgi:hypothetical protein
MHSHRMAWFTFFESQQHASRAVFAGYEWYSGKRGQPLSTSFGFSRQFTDARERLRHPHLPSLLINIEAFRVNEINLS